MAHDWTLKTLEKISALWKYCLSFRKRDWNLRDYPIRIRELKVDAGWDSARFKQARYVISVINWTAMDGIGDTREEAMDALEKRFQSEIVQRSLDLKPLPRPGTDVPIKFASQERVNKHSELSQDFARRILGLEWAWLSDESSLWHFTMNETDEQLIAKIKMIYGVDVSDIKSGNLSEIFDRIAASQSAHNPLH
jgi:hypothetical protein